MLTLRFEFTSPPPPASFYRELLQHIIDDVSAVYPMPTEATVTIEPLDG